MDTIYSRRKIKIPRFNRDNEKNNKIIKILVILFIAMLTLTIILKSINPIFKETCIEKVQEIATSITNIKSSEILKQKNYGNIVELVKDEAGNISVIKSDVVIINEIASDIAIAIQQELSKLQIEQISIPVGSFLGTNLLAGFGPNIKIKVIPVGNIKTDIKTEFVSTGINQTMHRIYLELNCEVKILTPFETIESTITNQVLLVETVIIGEIPSTYYNLEGMENKNLIDVVK